jgi:GGDEF domain-containing protein
MNQIGISKWEINTNRYVGIIDIMGFKDIVARHSHEKVYNLMKNVSNAVKNTDMHFSKIEDAFGKEEKLIFMTSYSDSIMIYSKDATSHSLSQFIYSIANLADELFFSKIPHKGAVAFGEMTLDFENSIFFGQPLIDAYLLQDELQFYGIVAHASIEYRRGFRKAELVKEYMCPFKTGSSNHFTISPTTFVMKADEDFEIEYLDLKKSIHSLRINTSGTLRKYIDNTINYLEYIKTI